MEIHKITVSLKRARGAESASFRVFSTQERFWTHALDHYLNPKEPWDRVLPRDLIKRVSKNSKDPGMREWNEHWSALYANLAEALKKGIQDAVKKPVYALCQQEVEQNGQSNRQEVYYFLADAGFAVVCDRNKVRTAYFPHAGPNPSKHQQYKTAWQHLSSKVFARQWSDGKQGRTVRTLQAERHSEDNWRTCPNPHPKPHTRPKPGARPNRWEQDA